MKKKAEDVKLVGYLRDHLTFGCIKGVTVSIYSFPEYLDVTVVLQPFVKFYQNDISFIRSRVLESKELRVFVPTARLYLFDSREDCISAVYKFR